MALGVRFRAHCVRLLAAATVVLVATLPVASPAHAAVVSTWSLQPANGSTVGTNIPVIVRGTVPLSPDVLVASTVKLSVDGVQVPRPAFTATTGRTSLYVYWAPSPVLPDGQRTFRVEVSDTVGRLSSRQWTTRIAQAPSATWVAPLAGAVVTDGVPAVTLLLADNTPSTTFTVAGQVRQGSASGPIIATFGGSGLPSGASSFVPSAELPEGTYYLTATVADAAGNIRALSGVSARMFETEIVPAMTVLRSCDTCHPEVKAAHPAPPTVDCAVCHSGYDGDHMEGTGFCEDCHWDGWHTGNAMASVAVISPCTKCHTAARAEVVQHTPASVEPSHRGSCGGCHVESIVDRHALTPEGSAYAYQCDLCHASTDPEVVAAIAAGDTTCGACHTGHWEEHDEPVPEACSGEGCHSGSNLIPLHSDDCAGCHDSTDAGVVAAIANNETTCGSCHSDLTGHIPLHDTEAPARCEGTCHGVSNLVTLHTALPCASCHRSGDPRVTGAIAASDKSCSACHDSDHEAFGSLAHEHFLAYSAARLYRAAAFWPTLTSAETGTCRNCHDGTGAATRAASNELCTTCHDASGIDQTGSEYPGASTYALSSHGADPAAVWTTRSEAEYAKGTHDLTAYSAGTGYLELMQGGNLAYLKPATVSPASAYGTPMSAYTDGAINNGGFFRGWIELKGLAFPTGTGYVGASIDLGQECLVTGYRVHTGNTSFGAAADQVSPYFGAPGVGTIGVPNRTLSATFAPVRTRYVGMSVIKRMYFYDPVDISSIGLNEIEVIGNAIKGTWTSPVIDLSSSEPATDATLSWTQSDLVIPPMQDLDWDDIPDYQPPGQSATVEANVSFDGGTTWSGWQTLTRVDGTTTAQIPQLPAGTGIANARIQYRVTLDKGSTNAAGPWVKDFSLRVSRTANNAASTYPGVTASNGACTNCHDPHGTSGSIGTRASGDALCYACHDEAGISPAADWRYKGATAYQSSAHAEQSCGVCHAVHGQADGAVLQPSLLRTGRTATCLACHDDGANAAGGTDVSARLTASANRLAHHSVTLNEHVAGNTSLECSDCHQPHSVTAEDPLTDAATGDSVDLTTVANPLTQIVVRATADTYLTDGYPATNHGGLARAVVAGDSPIDGYAERRALLLFDASQYPAASRITKATLRVITTTAQGAMNAYPLTADWLEGTDANPVEGNASGVGASWNNSYVPAGAAWTTPGGVFEASVRGVGVTVGSSGVQEIDVTDVVKWQLENGNHGLILVGDAGAYWEFYTRERNNYEKAVIVFDVDTTAQLSNDNGYCLQCHGGTPPSGIGLGSTRTINTWATDKHGGGIGRYRNAGYDAPSNPLEPFYYGFAPLTCQTCHDPHGSSNAYHLRETINGVTVTGIAADGTGSKAWCGACHSMPGHGSTADWQDCFGCHQHGVGF